MNPGHRTSTRKSDGADLQSDGAGGKGHSGLIIGNDKDGYIYIASDGRVDSPAAQSHPTVSR